MYRIKSILILFIFIALLLHFRFEFLGYPEVALENYSEKTLETNLAIQNSVLVFALPSYHVESQYIVDVINSNEVRRACWKKGLVVLQAKYNDWNSEAVRHLFSKVGHHKNPFLVLFIHGERPMVFANSEKQKAYEAIKQL